MLAKKNDSDPIIAGEEELVSGISRKSLVNRSSQMSLNTIDNATFGPKRNSVMCETSDITSSQAFNELIQPPQFLTTFESAMMRRASPTSRIESFRD